VRRISAEVVAPGWRFAIPLVFISDDLVVFGVVKNSRHGVANSHGRALVELATMQQIHQLVISARNTSEGLPEPDHFVQWTLGGAANCRRRVRTIHPSFNRILSFQLLADIS
jgi:hypothetical protein